MEENNLNNPNTEQKIDWKSSPASLITNTKDAHHKKLIKIISIFAIALFVVLIVLYFLNKRDANNVPEIVPTVEERVQNMEDTINATKEQGRPSVEAQINIMKLNSTE